MNARYVAAGVVSRHDQRFQPGMFCVGGVGCTPLLITCRSSGTSTEMSYVALSSGWSLLGYHHQEISGSLTASAPSAVRRHEVNPLTLTIDGMPESATTAVNGPLVR